MTAPHLQPRAELVDAMGLPVSPHWHRTFSTGAQPLHPTRPHDDPWQVLCAIIREEETARFVGLEARQERAA